MSVDPLGRAEAGGVVLHHARIEAVVDALAVREQRWCRGTGKPGLDASKDTKNSETQKFVPHVPVPHLLRRPHTHTHTTHTHIHTHTHTLRHGEER